MDWKKLIPHAIAIALMAIVALLYCSPVLKGDLLLQDDTLKNIAQAKEARDYRDANGEEALWTTRVFSGMTMFHIGTTFKTDVTFHLLNVVLGGLPHPVSRIFLLFVGFYLMLILFGVNHWLALAMSVAYGLSSNLIVSIVAGHNTKVLAIAFLAPSVAGVVMALNGRRLLGTLVVLVSIGFLVTSNHYQIMYYFLLITAVIGAVYLFYAWREKKLPDFAKSVGMLALAGLLALLPNMGKVYNTYEHSKLTIRGGDSELSTKEEKDKGGLDREYAMRWSYGPMETFTIVVPSFMGGSTGEPLPEGGHVDEELGRYNLSRQQKEAVLARAPMYIGEQPFILGTVYFGAGFIFLFILALFFVKGPTRAWILGIIVMSLIISWGRHFTFITGFLFDYFPMYNKFRTPSMAMAIAGIAIPVMGVLGLHRILSGEVDAATFKKHFKMALYITGGLMVMLLLYGVMSDWIGPKDDQLQSRQPWSIPELYEALLADRKSRYLSDWFISFLVMAVAAGLVWFYQKGKVKLITFAAILGVVFLGDLWRVSKRYLDNDDFVSKREYEKRFNPSQADRAILQDKDPHYRVLNATLNPWTDGMTCYHHKNVGGHHAAKLQRYQDLIENALGNQLQLLNKGLGQTDNGIFLNPQVSGAMSTYNMLNTKYFIVQGNTPGGAVRNPTACGNAWFVSDIQKVATADEEMNALNAFNPVQTAIVHEEFSESIYNYDFGKDGNASIQLQEITPKYLKYTSSNAQDGLAVFSEVYYPDGWYAYIDGEEAEIYRANYVLRMMKIPAGEHTIEMRFAPKSFSTGSNISLAGSALYLLFAGGLIYLMMKRRREEA